MIGQLRTLLRRLAAFLRPKREHLVIDFKPVVTIEIHLSGAEAHQADPNRIARLVAERLAEVANHRSRVTPFTP